MKKKTHDEYTNEILNKNILVEVLGIYDGSYVKIEHKCITCRYIWNTAPSVLLKSKRGCPKCANNVKRTKEQYSEILKNKRNSEYCILGDYINTDTHSKHKHLICGLEWDVTPAALLAGSSCPDCSKSYLKSQIITKCYLVKFNFAYDTYYKIGITQENEIKDRFKSDWKLFNFETVFIKEFKTVSDAKHFERLFLTTHSRFKYNTNMLRNGNTECFSEGIINEVFYI